MSNSLNDIPTQTLQRELARRGYKHFNPREDETTAEIIKLGEL